MSSNYVSRQKRNQNKKLMIVSAVAIIMAILVLLGLIKVIADGEEDSKGNQQTISVTPNPQQDNNQNLEEQATITPEATLTPTNTPTPIPTPTQAPLGPIIAIDPGHGGEEDWGTTRGELREKNANLAIALFLRDILQERGYRVYMIREEDVAVKNETRSGLAKDNGASLYVSVHINSLGEDTNSTQGAEVWYCDLYDTENDVLAQCIVDELTAFVGMKNRGIKLSNRLIVLRENTLPSCLVECGFMSSEEERAKLFTEDYQKLVAEGIANGIQKFMPIEAE